MGIVKMAAWTLVVACGLLGCVDDEECKDDYSYCQNTPLEPSTPLPLSVKIDPAGWDSVWVEVHEGTDVETGRLVDAWGVGRAGPDTWQSRLPEGHYCARAVYMHPGDTLEVFDEDKIDRTAITTDCGCFLGWAENLGALDLVEK